MEITHYNESHFDRLIEFLRVNWAENHSVYERALFDWQYKGSSQESVYGLMLVDGTNIKGFLGGVPYKFHLDSNRIYGVGGATRVVEASIKNTGVGLLMRKHMEEQFDLIYTMGLNLKTVSMYTKMRYNYSDGLNRYVVPLNAINYKKLSLLDIEQEKIEEWFDRIPFLSSAKAMESVDVNKLATLYNDSIKPHFRLLPLKDADFWQWRYIQSKGFRYLFFEDTGGIIIARVESVYAPGDDRHNLKCMRIIEMVPSYGDVWIGKSDEHLRALLSSVFMWARENNCNLADFQISNNKLDYFLKKVGFRKQGEREEADIVRLFSPLRLDANALNFAYRIKDGDEKVDIEDTYFVKSDCDMDRPNYLK